MFDYFRRQLISEFCGSGPVADSEGGADQPVERVSMIGGDRPRLLIARQRLIEAVEPAQYSATAPQCLGVVGSQGQRPVVARQCLRGPLQLAQYISAVGQRLSVLRSDGQRAFVV